MIGRIRGERIVTDGTSRRGYVYYRDGTIIAVTEDGDLPYDCETDAGNDCLSAGFVDTHAHGAAGVDFTFCTAEEALRAVAYHAAHGTTSILPTTLATDCAQTARALGTLRAAARDGSAYAGRIAGAHIEGPYFAPSMAGAQNPAYLTDPVEKDYLRILDSFGGFVKKWSYAPERDKDARFCEALTARGVTASAGHTAAVYDDFVRAYEIGLRCVTHLYSCTSTITRENCFRKLGVTECAYLYDDVDVELIADGRHAPRELIRLVFQLKGAAHVALVTDALSITGCAAREGSLNGVPYVVEDGVAKLADRSAFAGSIATADRLIAECVAAGVTLEDAVRAATETPARTVGLAKKGRIAAGYDADFVVFGADVEVRRVFAGGRELDITRSRTDLTQ